MMLRQSELFRAYEGVLLSLPWMQFFCLTVWCGTFLFLTFNLGDLALISLLLIIVGAYFISYPAITATDAITLLFGVTVGKGARVLLRLKAEGQRLKEEYDIPEFSIQHSAFSIFLIGLVLLLAFSSWWHLEVSDNFYHGPRWMGLWNNPNDYGLLMGVGTLLAVGLLAATNAECRMKKKKVGSGNSGASSQNSVRASLRRLLPIILILAAGMMAVGLLLSYSRGAWIGATVGLLYLAKAYGTFKWRWVLPPILVVVAVVCFFWNNTPETVPWYLKRLDLSRASTQHRIAAWKAGFEMMWDHPFGVGWNKAVETYQDNYSPPEGGAAAITTNDYLMLGTQLGWPGLICFVAYAALCLRSPRSKVQSQKPQSAREDNPPAALDIRLGTLDATKVACRAGVLAMLVTFWFDGGLFKLATASVFWILLELGANAEGRRKNAEISQKVEAFRKSEIGNRKSQIDQSLVISAATKQGAFTLIELLVVIAIMGILAAMLLPVLSHAKERARRVQCMNNLEQVNLALRMYADSNGQKFPTVNAGLWAWDVPWKVGDAMIENGASQKIFYCPSLGFSDVDNLNLWNFLTNDYRVVGYALTFPGTGTVLATNQNPSLIPQSITDPKTGVVHGPPSVSEQVLMADATLSQPHDADEIHRWLNTYVHVKGGYKKVHRTAHLDATMPAGGNVGMLDGHVEWRKFPQMHVRTDSTTPYPVFWW